MDTKEFIKKGIVLSGCGVIDEIKLDQTFFNNQEEDYGVIKEVFPIEQSVGGNILGSFSGGGLKGCIIVFKNGTLMAIESDGEYVDWFSANRQSKQSQEQNALLR